MRLSKWTLALAVAAATTAGGLRAQESFRSELTGNAYAADAYYQQGKEDAPSPSDKPAPKDASMAPAGGASCCDEGKEENDEDKCYTGICGWDRCHKWCEITCPDENLVRLFGENCFLKCHEITVGGWLNAGATVNGHNPASNFNGPLLFNDRDELLVNQMMVFAEKATPTGECCLSVGGKVELLYGTDARFIQSLGLETHQDGSNKWNGERFYQLAMPQLYAEFAYGDWKVKVGKFVTMLGYEVINAPGNFFYSHSYIFPYGIPFTHTGVWVNKTVNDNWSWHVCAHRGWERWEDDNDELAFMGGATWTSDDKNTSVVFSITSGDELAVFGDPTTDANRTAYSIILSQKINPRLTYVFEHNWGIQDNGFRPAGGAIEDAHWYGFNQYLFYQINCCWSAGMRLEYFRDDDGTRVANTISGNPTAGPFEGNFWEATWGLNWKPNSNVAVRPELRYDWFDGTGNPFDDGNASDQFTAAIDLIVHW